MSFLPEDKKVRCGYGPILSTDWLWRLAYKLKLTRHPRDPFLEVCELDDRLTDELNPYAKALSNGEELERVEEAFDEVNKDVKKPRLAWLYKGVLRSVRWIFD